MSICSLYTLQLEPSQAGELFAAGGEAMGVQEDGSDLSIVLDTRNGAPMDTLRLRISLSAFKFYLLIVKLGEALVWCFWWVRVSVPLLWCV